MLYILEKNSFFYLISIFIFFKQINASLQPIVIPASTSTANEQTSVYEFTPLATIIGFAFIIICFLFLAIAKIMFASSDQYMMNNRYDLVIFKAPTKNNGQLMGPRRVYSNSAANTHNLNAAQACGFDVSMLNSRNSYSALLSGLTKQN